MNTFRMSVVMGAVVCGLAVAPRGASAWEWKKPTGVKTEQASDQAMERRAKRRQAAAPNAQRIDDRMQRRDTVKGEEGTQRRLDRRDTVRKAMDLDQSGDVSKDEAKAYGKEVGTTYQENRLERGAQYIENRAQRDDVVAGPDANQDGVISPEEAAAYQKLTQQTYHDNTGDRHETYQDNKVERHDLIEPAVPPAPEAPASDSGTQP